VESQLTHVARAFVQHAPAGPTIGISTQLSGCTPTTHPALSASDKWSSHSICLEVPIEPAHSHWCDKQVNSTETAIRQEPEVRRQESEDRSQKTGVRRQDSEDRSQETGVRRQKARRRGRQETEDRSQLCGSCAFLRPMERSGSKIERAKAAKTLRGYNSGLDFTDVTQLNERLRGGPIGETAIGHQLSVFGN